MPKSDYSVTGSLRPREPPKYSSGSVGLPGFLQGTRFFKPREPGGLNQSGLIVQLVRLFGPSSNSSRSRLPRRSYRQTVITRTSTAKWRARELTAWLLEDPEYT